MEALIYALIYLAVVILTVEAAHNVILAVHRKWYPWQVGIKGIGGALFLSGSAFIRWKTINDMSIPALPLAVAMFGLALLYVPKLWETIKRSQN